MQTIRNAIQYESIYKIKSLRSENLVKKAMYMLS